MDVATRIKKRVYPARGDYLHVRFRERDWLDVLVPDDEVFSLCRELILQRVYEQAGPIPSGTVVDAGAHVGLFSVIAAQHARSVVAVEPDPLNRLILEWNLTRNAIGNVEVRQAALWPEPGQVTFRASFHSTGGSVSQDGGWPTEALTLDQLIDEVGPIDLLKLDIEGAEFDVLCGTDQLDRIDRIVGEMHLPAGRSAEPMLSHLRKVGYDTRVVPATDLYRPAQLPTVLRNWGRMPGHLRVKLGLVAYLLAPVQKPRRPRGSRDLPLFVARRDR